MADVVANAVRHHVQRLGGGEQTVVFLHGLVMDNLSSWYFTAAPPAARRADVLLYDLRGHGRSERPPSGYGLDVLLDDLAALLEDQVPDRPVALVGNSFGGLLALAFALRHPERVARLLLVDALLPEPGWGEAMAATLALEGARRDRLIAESFQSWLGRHSDRKRNRLARSAEALVHGTTLLDDLRASRSLPDTAYRDLSTPTLALYGADSNVLDRGERLAAAAPRCVLERWPGCTHSILWEATERLVGRITAWVTDA